MFKPDSIKIKPQVHWSILPNSSSSFSLANDKTDRFLVETDRFREKASLGASSSLATKT